MAFQGSSTNNKQNEDMQVYYCEVDAARCVRGGNDSDESSMNLSAVQERCSEIIEGLQDRYNVLHETFGMHGNQFQTLQQVWRSKGNISEEDTSSAPEELLARVSMPKDWNRYHIHPAALDGAFQLVGFLGNANDLEGSDTTNGASSSWVPAGIDHVEMHRSIGRHDQHAELACVAVSDLYRRGGAGVAIGTNLLDAAQAKALQLGRDSLFVLTTQTQDWFVENGFADATVEDLPETKQSLYNWQRSSKVLLKPLV